MTPREANFYCFDAQPNADILISSENLLETCLHAKERSAAKTLAAFCGCQRAL